MRKIDAICGPIRTTCDKSETPPMYQHRKQKRHLVVAGGTHTTESKVEGEASITNKYGGLENQYVWRWSTGVLLYATLSI